MGVELLIALGGHLITIYQILCFHVSALIVICHRNRGLVVSCITLYHEYIMSNYKSGDMSLLSLSYEAAALSFCKL